MPTPLTKKAINHGLRIFIILTLSGFILIFYFTGTSKIFEALKDFRFSYFLLALLLICVEILSGAGRTYIFIHKIGPLNRRQSFLASIKAYLANVFLAAATPFQSGGGIAQIYMLKRAGFSVSGATSVSIINFMATLGVLLIAGVTAFWRITTTVKNLPPIFIVSFILGVSYSLIVVFALFIFKPLTLSKSIEWILRKISRIWKKKSRNIENISYKIHDFVQSYKSHMLYFLKNEKWTLFHNIWLTLILYLNKCLMAYVVLKGMGLDPDIIEVISVQILLVFLIYFCPTPGASFLAEGFTAVLMSIIIPSKLVGVFSLLWRFFTTYFGVIIGGFILMHTIGGNSLKQDNFEQPSK